MLSSDLRLLQRPLLLLLPPSDRVGVVLPGLGEHGEERVEDAEELVWLWFGRVFSKSSQCLRKLQQETKKFKYQKKQQKSAEKL